ncbi:hypothetical protein [Roseateles amylovorans]|uniref:Uncharacterized protein n=1 Tax=Roseateles amylovorans TaxID=2978473 RepID=A0ABY6ASH0_9BURK|nr:hypothetical protein [Roseateles amylovorans]UXH76181.1 hypothetical protein N4261_13970 [Roseateles amylovorans]
MTDNQEKYLIARVDIPAVEALELVADRLSQLTGFVFKEEATGRYDEVPAFIAEQNEVEFILFGVPEGESGSYELKFRCETDRSIEAMLTRDAEGFLRQFVSDKSGAFMDYSDTLAQALIRHGIQGCRPIQPAGA